MKADTQWFITITYNGGDGKFEYESDQSDPALAAVVACKEMFVRCVWLNPPTTRISAVTVQRPQFEGGEGENSIG